MLAEHARRRRSTIGPGRAPRPAWRSRNVAAGGCPRGSTGPGSRAGARRARPASAASSRTCGLRSSPSGKRRRASERGASAAEHVALVLGVVGGGPQQRLARVGVVDARARSGRWRACSAPSCSASSSIASRRTLPLQRTQGFGVRPGGLVGEPVLDDAGAELGAQVDRQVRHAERVRERARAADRLRRAAAETRRRCWGPPTARASPPTGSSPPSATSRAATALSTPPLIATSVRPSAGASRVPGERAAAPSARCSASAASSAAWRLAGLSPPSSSAISSRADARGVEQRRVAQQRDDRAAGGDRGAAAAGVEAGVGDRAVRAVRGRARARCGSGRRRRRRRRRRCMRPRADGRARCGRSRWLLSSSALEITRASVGGCETLVG